MTPAPPPPLTDLSRLAAQRARAARQGSVEVLHEVAAAALKERLTEVNRTFTDIAIVTGHPGPWQAGFPDARVVPDAEVLDLAPGAQDLVIHGLALHWANDPVGQLVQARRALRPDGLFLGAAFGGRTLAELRSALAEAEAEVRGGLSPRVLPMADVRALGALLQRAGFALPVADIDPFTLQYRDAFHLMRDLRAMGEGNALAARDRAPLPRRLLHRAAELYARHHALPNGDIPATFEIVTLTGWAPDPGQPRPLRPGSAAARLADALGTVERPAGDVPGTGHD